jgi:hypothetical protein
MRRILPHVAVVLIYLMTPSAGEITENLVHLLTKGHTAHAVRDDAHQPTDPEHGCSGPFHVCTCHSSTAFTVARATVDVGATIRNETEVGWSTESTLSEGYLEAVFRPPIA